MKKIFVIAQEKDIVSVLEELRLLGIVHLEHHRPPHSGEVTALREKIHLVERVMAAWSPAHKQSPAAQIPADNWEDRAREIDGILNQLEELKESIARLQITISHWEMWGDFNPRDIQALKDHGVYVQLAELRPQDFSRIPPGVAVQTVFTKDKISRVLLLSREKIEWLFPVLSLPPASLAELSARQRHERERIGQLEKQIQDAGKYHEHFTRALLRLKEELAFQEAFAGRAGEETLVVLKGYCPAPQANALEQAARANQWGLIIGEPSEDDQVPTLLRNPRWVEMIKPVFELIHVLPGYREFDISLVFLLFFSVFFGMLIGDAGYGLLFLLATFYFHRRFSARLKNHAVFFLMYALSACAVAWGLLTGVFFGQAWMGGMMRPLAPWLADIQNVQMLCFLIGAIHLSIAHLWRAAVKAPAPESISEIGWLFLIWGMFFAARMLILGDPFPSYAKWIAIAGVICVLFFTKPSWNPLKAFGYGLGDLALKITGTFTDVVSYIRLFAVGLASVAVADAFNDMALGVGFGTAASGFFAALILVIGHVFNITLGAMAIIVHGLRLNVLEFSSHLGMAWNGFEYNPLRRFLPDEKEQEVSVHKGEGG